MSWMVRAASQAPGLVSQLSLTPAPAQSLQPESALMLSQEVRKVDIAPGPQPRFWSFLGSLSPRSASGGKEEKPLSRLFSRAGRTFTPH